MPKGSMHPSAMTPAPNTGTANVPAANTQAAKPAAHKDQTAKAAVPSRVEAGQVLFSKMNGATVYDTANKSVGDINNVVLDQDGRVAAVVIKRGGFLGIGGKTIAVGMNDLKMSTGKDGTLRFTVDKTQQQLKSAQNYSLKPPKSAASGSSAPPASHPATGRR